MHTHQLETKSADDLDSAFGDFMRAFEAFKDSNDERLGQLERRLSADVVTTDRLSRIDRALDELGQHRLHQDRRERRVRLHQPRRQPFVLFLDLPLLRGTEPAHAGCGPANRDIGHASYLEATHAFRGEGLKPLSPAHVRGLRSAGDLAISWVRRTRIGGDNWDAAEVPLGEEAERYEVDILDGTSVKRTLAAATPAVTYTAAQQTADFGAPQSSLSLRVFQLSAVFGRGTPRPATL